MQLRQVIDVAHVLLLEIYKDYGMKIEEASKELASRLVDPDDPRDAPKVQRRANVDEAASMAMLQSMMGGSDFKGPKG